MTREEIGSVAKAEGLKILQWLGRWPRTTVFTRSDDWQLRSVVCIFSDLKVNERHVHQWIMKNYIWLDPPLTDAERTEPEGVLEIKHDSSIARPFEFVANNRHAKLLVRPDLGECAVHDAWMLYSFSPDDVQAVAKLGIRIEI